jgi:hypothetical protein
MKNNIPGTKSFGAPDFQEAVREEPSREAGVIDMIPVPGTDDFVAASVLTATGLDKPWGQESVGPVMGIDPATLVILGKKAWYDGVYDYEHPVEPVGSAAPLPGGPQEPFVGMFMEPDENFDSGAGLPGDDDAGVARTDYYDGPKPINMDNVAPSTVGQTKLPGEQMPAKLTPNSQRPSHNQEHMFGTGELPGDGTDVTYDYDKDLGPDTTNRFEQQNTPYIKWDDNTPEMRPDPIHQRDPVQGPYVHNDLTERPSNG